MIKSSKFFFKKESFLELGCFNGDFCPNHGYRGFEMLRNSHNEAVSLADSEHGHRRTYPWNALKLDAIAAGLMVIYQPGISLFCISGRVMKNSFVVLAQLLEPETLCLRWAYVFNP